MYPAYRWTDSYPHHASPTHYAPNTDDQRAKEMQSHMKMDPFTMNSPYQPWPYGGNYCYPVPQEYHSCCNHGYFGGGPYSFRPPYSHYPPPPPFHSHGFYPPFPGAYPPYSIPPPHYTIEQPRYDYDKNANTPHHCCGCNHREEEKKPKIEQKEPEVDKKINDSLVPFITKDYPYPIMYVPRGYMNNESNTKEKEMHSHNPVELKLLEHPKQDRNEEKRRRDQEDGEGNRFPFPIFWLPLKNDEVGKDTKENDRDLVAHNELPDEKESQTRKNDEAESDTSSKRVVQKIIPVKQLEKEEEKKSPKEIEKKGKGMEEKASPKTSKLPPVCLRLDPLPRKKKSSRSPSPPREKEKSKETAIEKTKSSHQQTESSTQAIKKNKEEQSKTNFKTIEVKDDVNKVEKDSVSRSPSAPRDKEKSKETAIEKSKSSHQQTESSAQGIKKNKEEQSKSNVKTIQVKDNVNKVEKDSVADDSCENVQGQLSKGEPCKVEEKKKKKLSENEAASMIQSWYRGFEVRKSQPLLKLKKIAEVGKQVVELRNRIKDLESSSSSIGVDEKQKMIIGETIMSLLLKLDTIQGLHPIVRDVRKSVAKELVGLQEKLDSLTFVKHDTKTLSSENPEDDDIQDNSCSDQTQPHLDSDVKLVENREAEPTESQDEACNTDVEPQVEVELKNEPSIGEVNNDQLQAHEETEQLVDDNIQEKSGHVQAESGINVESMKSDVCENHEVEAAESQDDGGNTKVEPLMESESEQSTVEPFINTNNQLQMLETEQPVEQEKSESHSESNVESRMDVGSVVAEKVVTTVETPETKAEPPKEEATKEIQEDLMVSTEEAPKMDDVESSTEVLIEDLPLSATGSNVSELMEEKEKLTNSQLEISETEQQPEPEQTQAQENVESGDKDHTEVGWVDVEAKLPKEVLIDGIQEDFNVSIEEAPKVDDIDSSMEDVRGASPEKKTGGDKKLMEENEKLRVAVEELMKAGNEQLDVIKELTGRVKDLEKKLSKKKKIKVKKCRSRACDIEGELRSCIV